MPSSQLRHHYFRQGRLASQQQHSILVTGPLSSHLRFLTQSACPSRCQQHFYVAPKLRTNICPQANAVSLQGCLSLLLCGSSCRTLLNKLLPALPALPRKLPSFFIGSAIGASRSSNLQHKPIIIQANRTAIENSSFIRCMLRWRPQQHSCRADWKLLLTARSSQSSGSAYAALKRAHVCFY